MGLFANMHAKIMRKLIIVVTAALVLASTFSTARCSRKRTAGGPVIKGVSVEGVSHFSEKKIKGLMRTKESKFLRTKRFRESTLESDLRSIVAFYERNGFLNAQAEIDSLTYDDNRENIWIEVRVTEGAQTVIGSISLLGNSQITDDVLRKALTIKVGQPLNRPKVGSNNYNLYTVYADRGYVFASITHEIEGENAALDFLGLLLAPIYWMVDMGKVNVGLIYAIEM